MARDTLTVDSAAGEADPIGAGAYRPHLDGLRALAVYLVVLFHAGSRPFSGGYIGVDIFFVLSGYLVTQLLLRDVTRVGKIRFSRFYARRFRRLLAAAFVVLVVTGFVYTALASPAEVGKSLGSFRAAFLYVTNWQLIHTATTYGATDINANPIVQFWSLAVEEQFYFIWPVLLGSAFFLTRRLDSRRQFRMIRWFFALGMVASAAWALFLRTHHANWAYYGTDARAYELLAGALLALLPGLIDAATVRTSATRIAVPVCILVVLLLASDRITLGPIPRGIATTMTTFLLLLTLEAATGGPVKRALSSTPLVYLGKISYGTYLWHWVVILVILRVFQLSTLTTILIACLVATALASLSFALMEHPLRVAGLLDRHRALVIASGLTISLFSAFVFIPRIVSPAHATGKAVQGSAAGGLTRVPKDLTAFGPPGTPDGKTCPVRVLSACTIVTGSKGSVLLLGDSQAETLIPLFAEIARRDDLTFSRVWHAGCPWQRDLFTSYQIGECKRQKDAFYHHLLNRLHPDLVVVVELGYGDPGPVPRGLADKHDKLASKRTIERDTEASLAAIRADGPRVLLIEPTPVPVEPSPEFDPRACLATARAVEDCRYTADPSPSPMALLYRRLADGTSVRTLDLGPMICPLFPTCDEVVNGVVVKSDSVHITPKYSLRIAPQVETFLRAWGSSTVIPPRDPAGAR